MSEINREELHQTFSEQSRAADQRTRDILAAINGTTEEVRRMTSGFMKRRVDDNTSTNKGNGWIMLIGAAAIMFGLMAPMYIMVQGVGEAVGKFESRMRIDEERGREDAASFAQQAGALIEVETQFNTIDQRLRRIESHMDRDDNREEITISTLSSLNERLKFLEKKNDGMDR